MERTVSALVTAGSLLRRTLLLSDLTYTYITWAAGQRWRWFRHIFMSPVPGNDIVPSLVLNYVASACSWVSQYCTLGT